MKELKIHEGLIGYFDILGYQKILENNQIESVAQIISDIVLNLPDSTITKSKEYTIELFKKVPIPKEMLMGISEMLGEFQKLLDHLILSDSIIFVYPFSNELIQRMRKVDEGITDYFLWLFFIYQMSMLLRLSFEQGLPLRGAIDFGRYYLSGNCWAGKPIIDSYRLAGRLQMSGCALTANAGKIFQDLPKTGILSKGDSLQYFKYLTPLKDDNEEKMFMINWMDVMNLPKDLRQYVVESFHAHKKDVSRKDIPKLENTEMFLRHSLSRLKGYSFEAESGNKKVIEMLKQ